MRDVMLIDDPSTWPSGFLVAVRKIAEPLRYTARSITDLILSGDDQERLRLAADWISLRAYHATRLLPYEVEETKSQGLHQVTEDFLAKKLHEAVARGIVNKSEVKQLTEANGVLRFAVPDGGVWISAHLSIQSLTKNYDAVERWMSRWRGAVLDASRDESGLGEHLAQASRPAIVVVDIPTFRTLDRFDPILEKAIVGSYLGLHHEKLEVFIGQPIPWKHIAEVWTPDSPGTHLSDISAVL